MSYFIGRMALQEIAVQLVPLGSGSASPWNGDNLIDGIGIGDEGDVRWRQRVVEKAHIVDPAMELLTRSGAHPRGVLGLERLVQVVQVHLHLHRLAVDIDLYSGGNARTVVAEGHVANLPVRIDWRLGLDANGIVEPALHEMNVKS